MTNHKTEAMNYLTASTVDTHGDDDRKVAIAQVHATLYLAEQQRVRNIIAVTDMTFATLETAQKVWAEIGDSLGIDLNAGESND